MLLNILMDNQLLDVIVLEKFVEIRDWNKQRGTLDKLDWGLEARMLDEEYKEFFDSDELVAKFDALCDFGFVLGGTFAKWVQHPDDSDDANTFMRKQAGRFVDLYILFSKELGFATGNRDYSQLPEYVSMGLDAVIEANNKKGFEKDAHGKVIKPDNFVGPEPRLQEIIEEYRG
jgi:hypothetical protein